LLKTILVEDYPKLPACKDNKECRPGEADFGLPQFIKYIFLFSLGIVGIVGFIAILIAAFGYVTSVGNPQKAAEAKDKIVSALLGLLLLLGSYVILNVINPDLLKLKMEAESVKVEIEGGEEIEDECRLVQASWDKGIINEGDSATLTLKFSSECKDVWENIEFESTPPLKQHRPGGGRDAYCGEYYKGFSTNNEKLEHNWEYTFNSQCNETWIGTPLSACVGTGDMICNFIKHKPEIFYMEGRIEIKDGPTQYMDRLEIQVRDLKNGSCCK